MCSIHVLRKPLAASTVAANVFAYGAGALNIDACRISADLSEMQGRSGRASALNVVLWPGVHNPTDELWAPSTLGRWPSNLVLQHCHLCCCAGTKRVEATSIHGTVASWVCVEGCPVNSLDMQRCECGGVSRFFKQLHE